MKSKLFLATAVVAIAVMSVFNFGLNSDSNDLSSLMLANVEALAENEPTNKPTYHVAEKEVHQYIYNDDGSLDKIEIIKSKCCSSGGVLYVCSYNPC